METANDITDRPQKQLNFQDIFWLVAITMLLIIGVYSTIMMVKESKQSKQAWGYRYYVIPRPGWTDTFNCTDYGEYYDTQESAFKAATAHISKIKNMVADTNSLIIGGPYTFKTIKPHD
jgi:hypothetical protein